MKSAIASFIIFILLFISMIFSYKYLENKSDYYTIQTNTLEKLVNDNSWEEAYTLSNKFLDEWEKDSSIIPAFINHTYVETITNNVLKLTQYIKHKNDSDSQATIHEIRFFLENMIKIEHVTLPNVF